MSGRSATGSSAETFGADVCRSWGTVDRVPAFMESFDRASMSVNRGSRPGHVEAHVEAERHAGRWDGPLAHR